MLYKEKRFLLARAVNRGKNNMRKEIENELGTENIEKRVMKKPSAAIAKVEAALVNGAIEYCESADYQHIIIPHMTRATGACENFSTLFSTDLFGTTAYLNQTGQLMLEAFVHEFEKTYCFGPSFRKENKADARHLIEFPLFEIEVANLDIKGLQKEVSNIFGSMMKKAETNARSELEYLTGAKDLGDLKPPYKSITYRQAISQLVEYDLKFGDDLKSDHEQKLVQNNDGKPLFITHYPKEIKFFNMKVNKYDDTVVNSMDLLMPYSGESVGAAEREENHENLKKRLESSDMLRLLKNSISLEKGFEYAKPNDLHSEAMKRFDWYMKIIGAHPIIHAGCGIGINRVTQAVLGTEDIRYATTFPLNRETLF